ncbi:MAG: hypothetical protein QM736_09750 [Vicinamibacterales bacterium]
MWFNGFEYNFTARLPHGATLFGGGMSEKVLAQVCDEQSNPNLLLYCDQTKSDIPFRTQFKIAGSVPVVFGIQAGFSFQSLPGYGYGTGALAGREGGPTGPTGQPSATQLNTPNGVGTVWLNHADNDVHGVEPVRGARQVHGGPARRSGDDALVALGAAHRTEHRVRRSHQPARYQRDEDDPLRPRQHPAEVRSVQRAEHRAGVRHPLDELRHVVGTTSRHRS